MQEYNLGMICGRFGPIHKGHQMIINRGIEECKKLLILVGSAQESGTLRNPFTVDLRMNLIRKVYPDEKQIQIEKLEDMTNEYDINSIWGQYVIDRTIKYEGRFADIIISGNDESRKDWFSKEQIKNVKELLIDRKKIDISATELRGYVLINDKLMWNQLVPKEISDDFKKIRSDLLEVSVYEKILREMEQDITIQNYKRVYAKYEEADKKKKIESI